MMSAPESDRKRLGDLLIQRRIELSPRFRVRTVFAVECGLNWRLLYDLERGKRANFSDETLAAVEVAYRLRKGSIQDFLAGGELTAMETAQAPGAEPEDDPLTPDERAASEAFIAELRRRRAQIRAREERERQEQDRRGNGKGISALGG